MSHYSLLVRLKMKKQAFFFLLLFLVKATSSTSIPQDITPPSYTWISPEHFSILTTNTIRLCVEASDNGSGIEKVIYYASYKNNNNNLEHKLKIGEVRKYPFELYWGCSDIPDQRLGLLVFYCEVIDNAGNITQKASNMNEEGLNNVILDRNETISDKKLKSYQTNKEIVLDGILNEWTPGDSIVFLNNDNRIVTYSLWNKDSLYFGIRIEDKSIISRNESGKNDKFYDQINDNIEIYLDPDHDHSEILQFPDKRIIVYAGGLLVNISGTTDGEKYTKTIDYNVKAKIHIQGTIDNEQDIDGGYTIELMISFDEIGFDHTKMSGMGLEIWNADRDFINGSYFYAGWTTKASYLRNPSEWGNIVFVHDSNVIAKAVLIILIITCSCLVIIIILKKQKIFSKNAQDTQTPMENDYIARAKKYVDEHYSDVDLSRDKVANIIGLSPIYFGTLFKDETGKNFTDYIISLKINKAKHLLINTKKHISEIAYDVGFHSQSHFTRLFHAKVKMTPTDYREKKSKHLFH